MDALTGGSEGSWGGARAFGIPGRETATRGRGLNQLMVSEVANIKSGSDGSGSDSGSDSDRSVLTSLTWTGSGTEGDDEGDDDGDEGHDRNRGHRRWTAGGSRGTVALAEMADDDVTATFPIGGLQRPSPLIETPRDILHPTAGGGRGDEEGEDKNHRDKRADGDSADEANEDASTASGPAALLPACAPRPTDVLPAGHQSTLEVLLRTLEPTRASIHRASAFVIDSAPLGPLHLARWIGDSLDLPSTPLRLRLARLFLTSDVLANASAPVPGIGVLCT